MKRLGAISLPQNPPSEYSKQLSVMLYQYLRDIHEQINAIQGAIDVANYATRYDQDASTPTFAYLGKAAVSSATSAAVWQIQKLVFGTDGDVTITWADGNATFDNVWDNRAALTYT